MLHFHQRIKEKKGKRVPVMAVLDAAPVVPAAAVLPVVPAAVAAPAAVVAAQTKILQE